MSHHSDGANVPLFPVFVQLNGRRCLVIGIAPPAEQKVRELLECGARVEVIDPVEPAWLAAVKADLPGAVVRHTARAFLPGDSAQATVVISTLDDDAVNRRIVEDAKRAGALVNVVDVPDLCSFYAPALVRRGKIRVAIGTSGASPALAGAMRERIDALLPPSVAALVDVLGERRAELLRRYPDYADRARRMNCFTRACLDHLEVSTGRDEIEGWVQRALNCEERCADPTLCCVFRNRATMQRNDP